MSDKNRIIIFDTTMRDGEQSPGASMSLEEKLQISRVFDELGVDVIEAGFPIASPGDFEAVTEISKNLKKSVEQVILNFGGIDILISNAGTAFQGAIDTVDSKIIKDSYDINFLSHQNISQLAVQTMKKQSTGGLILYNLSKQAINPGKNFGPYGLAKSTTLFLMKQYALECGEYNIRVNGINADRIESGLLTKELINQRATSRGLS